MFGDTWPGGIFEILRAENGLQNWEFHLNGLRKDDYSSSLSWLSSSRYGLRESPALALVSSLCCQYFQIPSLLAQDFLVQECCL